MVIGKKAANSLDTLALHKLNPITYVLVRVSRSRSTKYDWLILPSGGKFVNVSQHAIYDALTIHAACKTTEFLVSIQYSAV